MNQIERESTLSCPARFKDNYPLFLCRDCMFWWGERCDYAAIVAIEENVGRLGTIYPELTKPQLRTLARQAGSFKTQNGG